MSFDRVSYVIEEEPDPPRRPHRARLGLLAVATVLSMGAVVTGASALTDQGAARQERQIVPHRAFHQFHHHHGLCPNMGGARGTASY